MFEIPKDSPNIETNNYCGFFMSTLAAIAMPHECGDLPSFQFQKTGFNTISAISLTFHSHFLKRSQNNYSVKEYILSFITIPKQTFCIQFI